MMEEISREPRRMHGASVVLLRVSRVFGVAPVHFERQRSFHIVRVSLKYATIGCGIYILIGVFMYTMLILQFRHVMNIPLESRPRHLSMGLLIQSINYLLTSIVFTVTTFGGANRMRRFIYYFTQIQKIHASIEDKPMSKSLEKLLSIILVVCLTYTIIVVIMKTFFEIYEILYIHNDVITNIATMLLYVKFIISSLLVLQVTFLTTSALCSLKYLNKCIEKLQDRIYNNETNSDDNSTIVNTIRRYTNIYETILDVCNQINSSEGLTMLLLLFNYSLRILAATYYTKKSYHVMGQSEENDGWIFVRFGTQLWHGLTQFSNILLLIDPCHRTHGELKRTQILLSQLLCVPQLATDSVSVELVRFYKHTEPYSYVYTPFSIFKFSRSLYAAIVGILSTLAFLLLNI